VAAASPMSLTATSCTGLLGGTVKGKLPFRICGAGTSCQPSTPLAGGLSAPHRTEAGQGERRGVPWV
jgi:hypothetical protein